MAWCSASVRRFVSLSMILTVARSALLLPEFEYEAVPGFSPVDDIERDLLFDGRSTWSYDGHDDLLGPGGESAYYQSDINLAALRPISPTPPFTLDPSYISPAEVIPARAKRANRARGRAMSKKQRKREQLKEHSFEEDDEDDGESDGKKHSGEPEESDIGGDVEDYVVRYEQFIAKHFDDVEQKREKSAPQRKAPAKRRDGEESDEDDRAEDDEEDERRDSDTDTDTDSDGDYKFDRFDYSSSDDYERIKAESEEQSRRLAKDPQNCRTYEKDGMVCSVCHDPASDSASESCAYATEPHHRKYAYVKERNYDSKNPDGVSAAGKAGQEELAEDEDDDGEGEHAESRPERQTNADGKPSTATITTTTSIPRRRIAHPIRKPTILRSKPHQLATNGGGYRYQPPAVDLRSNRANMKLRSVTTGEAKEDPNIYVMDYSDQDDVARVLADFKSRDWSNCRKGKRTGGDDGDGLTCYQCQDAAGVNHEECMYVSESRQVATGIAPPPGVAGETKLLKRKKVVPVRKGSIRTRTFDSGPLEPMVDGSPAKEKQTVKRTVSFRSFVTGKGQPATFSMDEDAASERVIHYEHHISHEVP